MNFIHWMLAVAASILLYFAVPSERAPESLALAVIRATLEKNPEFAGDTLHQDAPAAERQIADLKTDVIVATLQDECFVLSHLMLRSFASDVFAELQEFNALVLVHIKFLFTNSFALCTSFGKKL